MVAVPEQYPWSSFRAHVGLANCVWLDLDPCIANLAGSEQERRRSYWRFVEQGEDSADLQFIRESLQRGQVTASDEFADSVEQESGCTLPRRPRGRPRAAEYEK